MPKLIYVPCPLCGSSFTDSLDKKRTIWQCQHLTCQYIFLLKNHKAIVIEDGKVTVVDKKHLYKKAKTNEER